MGWGEVVVLGVIATAVGFFVGVGWSSRKLEKLPKEEEFESHQW